MTAGKKKGDTRACPFFSQKEIPLSKMSIVRPKTDFFCTSFEIDSRSR